MEISDRYVEKIRYFNGLGPKWNEIVGNDESRIMQIHDVFRMIPIIPGNSVLDVGCGNGILFKIIEDRIGDDGIIYAVDSAESMIRRAKSLHSEYQNIKFFAGLVEEVDLPVKYFDVIICFAVIPHIEDKIGALKLMRTLLKQEGKLYIFHLSDTRNLNEFHSNLDAPVKHDYLPDENEIRKIVKDAGFSLVKYIDKTNLNFIEIVPC